MNHNYAVRVYGICRCFCHEEYLRKCRCGADDSLKPPVKSRKPRKVNLSSRVTAFSGSKGRNIMQVGGREHTLHHPTVVKK